MLDSPIKCIWLEAIIKKIKQILNIYLEYKLFAAKKVFRFHSQANHFTADEPPVLQAAEKIRWCKFLFAGLLEGDVFVGDAARLRRKCRPTTQRPSSQSAPADRRRRRTVRGRH